MSIKSLPVLPFPELNVNINEISGIHLYFFEETRKLLASQKELCFELLLYIKYHFKKNNLIMFDYEIIKSILKYTELLSVKKNNYGELHSLSSPTIDIKIYNTELPLFNFSRFSIKNKTIHFIFWYKNGLLHNDFGPAVQIDNLKCYYINGIPYKDGYGNLNVSRYTLFHDFNWFHYNSNGLLSNINIPNGYAVKFIIDNIALNYNNGIFQSLCYYDSGITIISKISVKKSKYSNFLYTPNLIQTINYIFIPDSSRLICLLRKNQNIMYVFEYNYTI